MRELGDLSSVAVFSSDIARQQFEQWALWCGILHVRVGIVIEKNVETIPETIAKFNDVVAERLEVERLRDLQ